MSRNKKNWTSQECDVQFFLIYKGLTLEVIIAFCSGLATYLAVLRYAFLRIYTTVLETE